MTMQLAERVQAVFMDCLFKEGEPTDSAVIGKGVVRDFGFHPERLANHKAEIAEMCNELPDTFQKKSGGGWSFLNLCMDKHGTQWGEHANCEQLVALAIASGQGSYPLPREMWQVLPGGMPYVAFDTAA